MQQENCTTKRDRIQESAKLTLNIKEARFYFTQNLTEWERRSVAWDLFQYGQEVLEKVAQPSYSFTVDSADFLVMDEFETFKNALSLGKRAYLKLDNGRVLTPLLLGFSHTFDEKSALTLEFSNKFTSNDENDRLVDLLEQSVSMGKKLDLSREVYSAFVNSHANTAIHDFMNGALDVAKNAILSTTGQAISWDENGLRLRKWNSDHTGYEDEQIWMKDNLIVFTEDAWQHAKMAIGHIHDNELGDLWGVIADSIVGKLLAGENLIIMGTDSTGKKTLFRVDGSGMYAYNSRFWMESANGGAFAVDPSFGLGLGQGNPFTAGSDGTIIPKCIDPRTGALKLDKDGFPVGMNFWAGMDGQLYIRGKVFATGGEFTGVVKAQDFLLPSGDTMVSILNRDKKIKSDWLDLMGINIKNDAGQTVMTIDQTGVKFGTGFSPVKYQYSVNGTSGWHDTMTANDKYRRESYDGGGTWAPGYQFKGTDGKNGANGSDAKVPSYITTTKITSTTIESPKIYGAEIHGAQFFDYGGGFSFMSSNGATQWGTITYETDGINIGAVDGIVLDGGQHTPMVVDIETGEKSRIVSANWLKSHPPTAVFA